MSKSRSGLIKDSDVSVKARKKQSRKGNANNFIDETGQRYGRLLVLTSDGRYNNEVTWECRCDCGNVVKNVRGTSLRKKETQSCGCLHKEQVARANKDRTNPRKSEYSSLAQQMHLTGMSYAAIARHFTDNQIPSLRGGKWYSSTIKWLIGVGGLPGTGNSLGKCRKNSKPKL